jgi:hypothetical protein
MAVQKPTRRGGKARSARKDSMRKGLKKDAVAAALAATLVSGAGVAQAQKVDAGQTTRYGVGAQGARRGRPRKFSRPSRAVTLTLPDDVISALQAIETTSVAQSSGRYNRYLADVSRKPAELTTYGGRAVIVVPRNRAPQRAHGRGIGATPGRPRADCLR